MLNTIKSYAKINLFLNVVNKLDTGFHELNSVLSRIDLYDEIRIKDENLASKWLNYHDNKAQYRLLCSSCNSHFGSYGY